MVKQAIKATDQSNEEGRSFADRLLDNLSKVVTLVLFSTLLYGAHLIFEQVDQPITKITIGGDFKHLDHRELAGLVNGEIGGGFLTVDLATLQKALRQHPWVSQVSVQRQWPSHLQMSVVEEVPIARWGEDAFLNRLGDRLSIADNSDLANLPLLTAQFGSSSEVMRQYQRLAELLLPTGLKLSELKLDSLGAWQAQTSKGIQLVIGRDQVGEKIRRLVLVWGSGLHLQSDNIETIDLRYPNGLAVAWRNKATVGAVNNDGAGKDSIIRG